MIFQLYLYHERVYVKRWRIETTVVIVLIKCLTILCIKVKRLVFDVESCSFSDGFKTDLLSSSVTQGITLSLSFRTPSEHSATNLINFLPFRRQGLTKHLIHVV